MRSALGVYLQDMTFVNVDLENAAYKLMYDTQNELGPTLTLEQAKNQVRNSVDFDRSRRLANESVKLLHSQYELNQVLNSEINSGKTMRQLKKELNKNIQDYHNRVKGNDAAAQATRRQKTYDESQGVTENRRSYLWTGNRPPLQSVVDLANRTKIGVPNGIGADRTVTLNQGVGLVQYSNKEALSIDGMKLLIKDIGVYDDAGGINTDGIDKTFNIMFKNSEVENNASARYYQSRKVGLWEVPDTGYENALLYKRDWELIRKYFTERVTDSISTARNEYKMRQDITAAFRNTYYMATARAIDNVGWKYRLDNNQSKFIFNQVYGQIHKESPKVSARSNLTNAFVSGRVSSALGGIRQATFMNVPEVGYILMMRGQSFKDVIPHLWRNREELKSRYSAISDISDNDMAAIGKLSGVTNATQLMAKIATSPFGFTQRLSSYIFLASADLTAQKNGLTGPQRSMYVQHAFNKMAITNSGLSALTTAQGAMGKFMIFQNWLLKDYKRLINTIGSNINDTDIPPVQRFRGATRALTAWLGVKGATWVGMSLLFNTTFGSVFGANPFGIFDTYDELSEQERVWFDGIVDFFDKFMFLAQPATDLYYSLRNSVWATPKTDTDAEGNPVGEVASSPFDFGQWAGNALLDVTPAGGHIKAVADSMRLMNEGASYGSTGVRQYESPEDFMNILRAFLTGKGSTDNAMEYKQQASFNNLLNALSNGEDLWDAVDDELTKLQNDPWIMGVLDFIPGAQSELDAQRAEAATQQWKNPNGRVFMPYKVTTDPDEPGGNFNGGYGDGQKFNNEYYKLKKRHDDPDFLAAARRIYSQYAFWSTQEGSEAKAEADKFMRQFNSLTKDLVDDIRILADNWIAAGHEYGEKEMTMLRSLLDFGVEAVTGFDLSEARTREYAQSALPERTDVARLYYVTQAQKAAQNRSYGAPEAMVADFKQVLEGGNGVPKLREAYDKYWAEIRSASAKQDYSKANALAWEYIEKQFVPRIQGVVGEYGPDIAINNKEIIEMLADLMIVPNEAMSVKNKQGRYVSTKGSPMLNVAEGVVRNFIKNLYGAYGDDAPNRASDYAVTTGVRDIKIALESGQEGRAKSIADRLYTQIDAGEIHASPTDFGIIQDAR